MFKYTMYETAPKTILHLGARGGNRLQDFRNAGAEQIILVEQEKSAATDLQRLVTEQRGVRVIAAAVGAKDGRGELSVMSLPELSSLAQPGPKLTELYPGLRRESVQEVDVISPLTLVRDMDQAARPLMLVVESPGQELEILKAWKDAAALESVDLLEIHCSEEILYEGGSDRAGIEAWLEKECFKLARRDVTDPDWPVLHLWSDQTARDLSRTKVQMAELEKVAEQTAAALAETEAKLTAAADHAAALEKTLAETKAGTEAKAAALTETEAKLKTAADHAAALEKTLAETKAGAEAKAAALTETEAKLKTATDRAAALERSVATMKAQIARQIEEIERNQVDQRNARHDLGLALRMQTRLQGDLRDLQTRYEAALASKTEHEELLQQLAPRLREAAQHLQAMSLLDDTGPQNDRLPPRAAKADPKPRTKNPKRT